MNAEIKPLVKGGVVLGIGMGGFVDGIVFHQILQLHAMLSAKLPKDNLVNLQTNMFLDGMFHAFTWIAVIIGLTLVFQAGKKRDVVWDGKLLSFAALFGWGLFNLAEGIIDHHILHLHHVVEALGVSVYDYAFLASGIVFMVAGWLGIKSREQAPNYQPKPLRA